MRWQILFLSFILLIPFSFAQLQINEIMYAPTGDWGGQYNEWIELYNPVNVSINVSRCLIDGKEFGSSVVEPFSFLLVANKLETFAEIYSKISAVDGSFSLKNEGDSINLTCHNSSILFEYEDILTDNNKTLERRSDDSWSEGLIDGGTPGQENSIFNFSSEISQIVISEIFPNPFDEDNVTKPNGEWVEIYNQGNKPIYLRDFFLKDKAGKKLEITSDKVLDKTDLIIYPKEYLVVYRDSEKYFTLNNNRDEDVVLFSGDEMIDNMSYSRTVEDMSISKIDGNWYITSSTPGYDNYLEEGCDWYVYLNFDNFIFINDALSFGVEVGRLVGLPQNITVRGEIIDLNGEIVKTYAPWTNEPIANIKSKSYSPNLPEGTYQIFFWIEDLQCEETDTDDNTIVALMAINPYVYLSESDILIEKIYLGNDNQAEWGDQFDVKLDIYKGMETKYSVQLWAEKDGEKISKTSKISIFENYRHYPITLPIQLIPNCNNKIEDGTAKIVLEAFGLKQEMNFEIEGVDENLCKDYLDYVKEMEKDEEKKQKQKLSHKMIDLADSVDSGGVIRLQAQLVNDDSEHDYQLWSYVYRGSKCYSCLDSSQERDINKRSVSLQANEVRMVDFLLKLDEEIKEGEYKVKVKIQKDGQKTVKELTETIYVQEKIEISETDSSLRTLAGDLSEGISGAASLSSEKQELNKDYPGIVVYESSSQKARKTIPVFMAITFGLICLVLVWKK